MGDSVSEIGVQCIGGLKASVLVSGGGTVGELRRAVLAALEKEGTPTQSCKLIVNGKTLSEDAANLNECKINSTTKVMVLAAACPPQIQAQEDRSARLDRLKAAVEAMAARSTGGSRMPAFEIENQAGQGLNFSEVDKKALKIGLAMHLQGKENLRQGALKDALEQLLVAEEAFDMVPTALTDSIDNLALLKLDIVWCLFQLQDQSQLAAAASRLKSVRKGLERSHGADLSRLRQMHGEFRPEMAIYVRLELLEGVVAFLTGCKDKARKLLQQSQAKWRRLQVSDTSLAELLNMGFSATEASRALRFSGGNENKAAEFALEQQRLAKERREKDKKRAASDKEQRKYGKTAKGRPVNMEALEQLQGMLGYSRPLLALALQQTENSGDAALDLLTDEDTRDALQSQISMAEEKQVKKRRVDDKRAQLVALEFQPAQVEAALAKLGGDCDVQAAVELILSGQAMPPLGGQTQPNSDGSGNHAGPSSSLEAKESEAIVDTELESKIADGVEEDPLAAYDVDVAAEGEAIQTYLKLVE